LIFFSFEGEAITYSFFIKKEKNTIIKIKKNREEKKEKE
jgi:hypothetical protein